MTEKELIRGVIDGEREALSRLVEDHRHKVIKTAYYFLGNMEDAEDLAQDIFLEVVTSMEKFRQNARLSTWIYRITVNRSLNALKKKKRRGAFVWLESIAGMNTNTAEQPDGMNQPEQAMAAKENRKLLKEAVGALPKNQRTAFILCRYEELPNREIAEIMGLSLSSVEALLHRAKINLRESLANQFTEYSTRKS
ncbi:MAG: RNA polymerase sigma factor [Bacteroidales bacterium]|nr:RNA polymerase sigma factor [Bacteroidales bacterium]